MRKIITITDPMQVKIGDKAYFKDCDFGFIVIDVDKYDEHFGIKVNIPISEDGYWADSSLFDHATREVKESEWPDPQDIELHIYLGADGVRYIYNPCVKQDTSPWTEEGAFLALDRQQMASISPEAIPLTELKLVPAKDDGNEQ